MPVSKPMLCDCGCDQIMGIDYGDKVVIKARHHGKDHFLTVPKFIDSRDSEYTQELEERVAGSTN